MVKLMHHSFYACTWHVISILDHSYLGLITLHEIYLFLLISFTAWCIPGKDRRPITAPHLLRDEDFRLAYWSTSMYMGAMLRIEKHSGYFNSTHTYTGHLVYGN
jgi:hypothetical protein